MIKKIDKALFAELAKQAEQSPRKRANRNFHADYSAPVQRLFITMQPGSYVRPHQHVEKNKWEFFLVLSGCLLFILYDQKGLIIDKIKLSADLDTQGIEIPPNCWHSTIALTESCFLEVKEGPYSVMTDKGFADWSPEEGSHEVADFINYLCHAEVGDDASSWRYSNEL